MNKQYDRTALVQAYIQANKPYHKHEDFKTYAAGLLEALQRAFEINLSHEGVHNQEALAIRMLFKATARSYLSIRTPRSSFLEDSLVNTRLEQLGKQGDHIASLEAKIYEATNVNTTAHLELLYSLFVILWGPIDTIVTSHDLQQLGFDDAAEPNPFDYIDYL